MTRIVSDVDTQVDAMLAQGKLYRLDGGSAVVTAIANGSDQLIPSDERRAVEPLERTREWEPGEVPETYPSAL